MGDVIDFFEKKNILEARKMTTLERAAFDWRIHAISELSECLCSGCRKVRENDEYPFHIFGMRCYCQECRKTS